MKKIISFLSLFCLFLVACKKDKTPESNLQSLASDIKIVPIHIYGDKVVLSFIEQYPDPAASAKFQVKRADETNWMDVSYTDKNYIPVTGLTPNVKYQSRVELSRSGEQKYSPVFEFTTQIFSINYTKFFSGPPKLHDAANNLFSLEGAVHTIYGAGFKNLPSIDVTLTAVDNLSDVLKIPAVVINDSTLTFAIPRNLVSDDPYKNNKIYSCMIGDIPLIGYGNFMQQIYGVTGDFTVVNRDIIINKFTYTPSSCPILSFGGYFATNEDATVCPATLFGISTIMSERKLILKSGGSLVREILLKPSSAAACDGMGSAPADPVALAKEMLAYHEVTSVNIRSTIPSGTYTAQVKQTAKDGTTYLSNEFIFTF